MEVAQTQPFVGEIIQRGRGNLAAERANIRVTHVVGNNEQDIGLLNGRWSLSLLLRLLAAGSKLHDQQYETYKQIPLHADH